MKKRFLSWIMVLSYIFTTFATLNVNAALGNETQIYFLGPREYVLSEEYLISAENAKANNKALEIEPGGSASYGFYLPFNAESITMTFAGKPVPITVSNGTETYIVEPGDEKTFTYDLAVNDRIGEKVYTFSAESKASLSKIAFDVAKEWSSFEAGEAAPAISDEEFMLQTAVLIKTDSPMIIVNNGRRYIDIEDRNAFPIYVNGSVYLPVHTLARALSLYYEDLPDKKYVLLRYQSDELVFTENFSYSNNIHGEKTPIENVVHYANGRTYLPVRYIAEFYGRCVGYKDGLIAIDDNKYYVADFLDENTSVNKYIQDRFAELQPDNTIGKTYYVAKSANASDTNPGTYEAPFATISKAGQVAMAGDTVIVREGVYRETVTVKNNGTPTAPIVFKAAEGEKVVISATEVIDDFISYGENMVVASYPYDLGYGKNQVFFGEKSVPEARYPNEPAIRLGGDNEPLSDNWPVAAPLTTDADNHLRVEHKDLLNQPEGTWDGAKFICLRGHAYATSYAMVKHSKPGELELTNTSKYFWNPTSVNGQVKWGYLVGARAAIDLPGEWVVENDTLIMMPPEGTTVDNLSVEVKARQLVIDIPDNKCVQFDGFTTIGGSMRLNNSELCVIKDCTIKYNNHYTYSMDQRSGYIDDCNYDDPNGAPTRGEVGLYVGGYDNILVNNTFDEAAGAAIYGVGCYAYIENNLIKSCGYGGSYVAGISFPGEAWRAADTPRGGMTVVGNTAYNAGRSVLMTQNPSGSAWERAVIPYEVAYNEFYNSMLTSLDTGIIYTYLTDHGNNRRKTQMHNNLIYCTFDESWPFSMGLYHDGGTMNIDTYNNLIFCAEPGVSYTQESYVMTHLRPLNWHQADIWANEELKHAVVGGRDGLKPDDFPYNMMFDAGSTIGRDDYTKNYEQIINNQAEAGIDVDFIDTENAVLSENAERVGTDVRLEGAGDWIKFSDIDFDVAGAKNLEIYFKGDRYNTAPQMTVFVDDCEIGKSFQVPVFYFRARTADDREMMITKITGVTGKHDVYIKITEAAGYIDISGVKLVDMPNNEPNNSIIYCGSFTDVKTTQTDGNMPVVMYGAEGDYDNSYVSNARTGDCFLYENADIEYLSDIAEIKYKVPKGQGGQKLQIRLGSPDAEPVGEFVLEETDDDEWKEDFVDLKKVAEPGKYEIYLTLSDDNGAAGTKSIDLYYIKFSSYEQYDVIKRTKHAADFTEAIAAPLGEFPPAINTSTNGDSITEFVNNTWPGTILVYKDWEVTKPSSKIIANHCTGTVYSGQSVQIRIGSKDAEPIAEFKTIGNGWSAWTDVEVPLNRILQPGTYDIYVTFMEPDGQYVGKSANFAYFRFDE